MMATNAAKNKIEEWYIKYLVSDSNKEPEINDANWIPYNNAVLLIRDRNKDQQVSYVFVKAQDMAGNTTIKKIKHTFSTPL